MVWYCLGLSLAAMAVSITSLSAFYRKYIDRKDVESSSPSVIQRQSIDFSYSLGGNAIVVWSHLLTNRCNSLLLKVITT